ncbi:hypothetical protein MMC21_003775 [Puttea exsequens]|nr:hypothetical protein [Puttea exsequens]
MLFLLSQLLPLIPAGPIWVPNAISTTSSDYKLNGWCTFILRHKGCQDSGTYDDGTSWTEICHEQSDDWVASLSLFDINQKAMPVSPSGDHHWVNDGHVDSNDPMAVNFTTNGVLANDFQVAPDLYEGWDTPGVAIDFRIGRAVFQSAKAAQCDEHGDGQVNGAMGDTPNLDQLAVYCYDYYDGGYEVRGGWTCEDNDDHN